VVVGRSARLPLRTRLGLLHDALEFAQRFPIVVSALSRAEPSDGLSGLVAFHFRDLAATLEAFERLQERLPLQLQSALAEPELVRSRNALHPRKPTRRYVERRIVENAVDGRDHVVGLGEQAGQLIDAFRRPLAGLGAIRAFPSEGAR